MLSFNEVGSLSLKHQQKYHDNLLTNIPDPSFLSPSPFFLSLAYNLIMNTTALFLHKEYMTISHIWMAPQLPSD
jgi:hypothetical protein